jgi:hypothetical protein
MVAEWVAWATAHVADWPDVVTDAPFDVAAAEDGVRRAERVEALVRRA